MPIDPLGIESSTTVADPLGIEAKGVDPLGIERPAQKLGMSGEQPPVYHIQPGPYERGPLTPDMVSYPPTQKPDLNWEGLPMAQIRREGQPPDINTYSGMMQAILGGPSPMTQLNRFLVGLSNRAGAPVKEAYSLDPQALLSPEFFQKNVTSELEPLTSPILGPEVQRGVSDFANQTMSSLTDLKVAAPMLGGVLVPEAVIPAQRYFQTTMASQAPESVQAAVDAAKQGNTPEAVSQGLASLLNIGTPIGIAGHLAKDPLEIEAQASSETPVEQASTKTPVEQVPRTLTPQEAMNLGHEMKGLAQGVMYANYLGKDTTPLVQAADKVWEKAHQTGDYQGALAEIATLKSQLSGAKAKVEGTAPTPTSVLTPGFEASQKGPSALVEGKVEGRKYPSMSADEVSALETGLEEPKLSGPPTVLSEFKGETNDGTQMLNRLRNKLPPAEWDIYQKVGIEEEFGGKKVPASAVAKWMEEKGPRVEVHTYGMEGKVSEARKEYDLLRHEIDSFPQAEVQKEFLGRPSSLPKEQSAKITRFLELEKQVRNDVESGPRATSAYSHVSPKDVKKFPLQRVDVTVQTPRIGHQLMSGERLRPVLWNADSIHEQIPNTLGWTAYQDLPHEKYGEVRNAVEVQSRWGQRARQYAQEAKQGIRPETQVGKQLAESISHPLLHDYNRLILKAFIEQARKDGKRYVSIPDAETAMMNEGHDANVPTGRIVGDRFDSRYEAEQYLKERLSEENQRQYTVFKQGNDWIIRNIPERVRPSQELGMRLNYDTILPKIMEELTGQKGERVELGEHKNAFVDDSYREGATAAGREAGLTRPRNNLIFRNPDGTPKTSATGLVYDISKVNPEKFTLFGKDKLKAEGPLEKGVGEPGESPAYRRFDVRTPEGKKLVELRGTQDLIRDLGIEPGIARYKGERATNQGPQAYTAFNKLSVEQLYDKWDLVKRAKEQVDKEWRQTAKAEHPDVGGDAAKMADANAKHDFVEAAFKELQRRFDKKGVDTATYDSEGKVIDKGFDREVARLERMRKADEKISPEAPKGLSSEDSAHYDALQLSNPGSMHDVVSRMAESDEFSPQEQALATYLRDNFEHVLRSAKVKPEGALESGRKGAGYKGMLHEVRLAVGAKETGSIAFKVLEEGTHAALTWQLEHPVTEVQRSAVAALKSIMERTMDQLPEDVKFKLSPEGRRISGEPVSGLAYRYNNLHEFVAGLISDPDLQVHLNNIQLEGIPAWKKVWHALLDLLHIKPESALDHALQELTKVGAERGEGWSESVKDYHAANYEGASTPALRSAGLMDSLTREAPAQGSSTVVDKRLKDEFMQRYNAARGWSAPRHATASEEVANKLVRYASARQAAPEIAKWMATDVLGDKWQDPEFDNRLGAVLVEDRLRATEKSFRDMAARATDPGERAELLTKADNVAHIFAPGEMARQLADPEIAAAIERHKATVQQMAQEQHEKLGGRLAAMGESTDAFVNLKAMLSPDDAESAQSLIFGSRKGELTNPMKRGSVFNKPTKGTASNYELSYRNIAERMIRGNYEQVALRDYYKAMVDKWLAVEEKPGAVPTTMKGGKLSPVTIEMRGSAPGMTRIRKLWIRPDLKSELIQATSTDQPFGSGAVRAVLDAITEVQVQGPTDALYHGANMLAVLAGSQGSKTWLYDVLRKGTPVGFLDSAIRIGYNAIKAYHDAPETQHLWAEISRIGAGREKPSHETMITKGLTKLGVPEKIAKGVQPSTWSSAAIRIVDKGGRMAAAKMYDNLVERGWAKDSELDKREFINRMGQYNSRLMTRTESALRELSLSSFVVAGKNMNRQAMRRLLTSPGFRGANPAARAKLRVTEALTLVSMLAAVPAIINSYTTGSWKGRPGTPFGAIDTGQDDKATGRPKIIDLLQLLLLRRAMRMTGMEAYRRAQGQGLNAGDTAHEMVKDAIGAYIHPWMGPGARFAMTAASGREPAVPMNEGYLLSKNPNSFAANAWASAKNMNPTLAQMMKGEEEGTGIVQTPLQSAKAAFGFKLGRNPSWEERQTALTSKLYPGRQWEQLNVGEKRAVQDQLNKQRDEQPSSRTELGRLAAGEKAYWEQAQRDRDLKESLPKHQQKWLDSLGLKVSGFGTEVTLGKVRLPSTPSEKEALMKAMTGSYTEAVKSLMGEEWFNKLDKGQKQEVLDKVLTRARKPVLGQFKGGQLTPTVSP